ncbi:hypothetical protein [Spiroplasma endosymbiont of Tricholauxania praeusta]|uniref:hypothetical protein n=1 Tax=Spiroplasma endosymbiont of Tricholauxania praeusta TaxID=3066296 RepID=UPI0030CFF727
MKNKIKDKVYKYVEKFLFENREIWNRFVFINENGVNKKISLMKLWDLIKTKKQYEDLEKLFWNEINKYYLEVIEINLKDNFNILMESLNFLQDNWFFSSIFFEVKGNLIFIFNKLNFLISNKEILELKNNDLWIDLPSNQLVYEINSLFLLSFSLSNKTNFN